VYIVFCLFGSFVVFTVQFVSIFEELFSLGYSSYIFRLA